MTEYDLRTRRALRQVTLLEFGFGPETMQRCKLCPECGGVMHCHSPWSVAWAYSHDVLPMTTLHVQLKIGYDIPVFDIPSANVRPIDAPLLEAAFRANPKLRAFILRGHGIVALGKDVLEAEHTAELIEETAQIATLKAMQEQLVQPVHG